MKTKHFLSLVCIINSFREDLNLIFSKLDNILKASSELSEIIVIDNSANPNCSLLLKNLCTTVEIKDLNVLVLSHRVDPLSAAWAGIENSLGDYVCIFNPDQDDIGTISKLYSEIDSGADIIYSSPAISSKESLSYRLMKSFFILILKVINNPISYKRYPEFRVLSRQVINYIGQHPQPMIKYKFLGEDSAFEVKTISYEPVKNVVFKKNLRNGINDGFELITSSTKTPMRLVTLLSMLGAVFSLGYSAFVLVSAISNGNIVEGWASISLQFSFMFFLFSIVLLILSEYILQMTRLSNEAPDYLIIKEYSSETSQTYKSRNIDINQ